FLDPPLSHLTTFGGNPVACAAAIAAFDLIMEEGLVERAIETGEYLRERLESVRRQFPDSLVAIRGLGLWFAIDLAPPTITQPVVGQMQDRGVIVGSMLNSEGTIRIAPPLTVTHTEIDTLIGVLRHSLEAVRDR
ncbi:MAG: aminotransferase class III-fold pyridoxal phosphate-dependent enzyme, partial [Acidimicrobiia bacterium]